MTNPIPAAVLIFLSVGCARLSTDHEPVFHTPLAESEYTPPKRPATSPETTETIELENDVRDKAVAFATELLKVAPPTSDFGEHDVKKMLEHIGIDIEWSPEKGVVALARLSRKKKAYAADGHPLPGDIVLFHNQRDSNENGVSDDWLTGCGIVTKSEFGRFEAVIRTGNAPRRVAVRPLSPSVRESNGEIYNSFVRIPSRFDPEDAMYLAGQLYAGHINIEKLPDR